MEEFAIKTLETECKLSTQQPIEIDELVIIAPDAFNLMNKLTFDLEDGEHLVR